MTKLFASILILFIVLQTICVGGGTFEKIEETVQKYVESGDIHGTVLVAKEGTVIYKKAFGMANMEWKIPNDTDTKYRIYSMSKQFTALLIMQLVESGKLDLHTPISAYLPYYRKDIADKVTPHHLLTHTHGIAEGYDRLPPFIITEPTRELIEKYFSNDLDYQPGSKFRYSGLLGYTILGALIEAVTGEQYKNVLKQQILDPAGMKNTKYLDYQQLIEKRAADYSKTDQGCEHRIQAYTIHANGASCLVSTVDDLLRWDQALYSNVLLSNRYQDELFSPRITQYAPYYYGYGWYIVDLQLKDVQKRIYYHTGGGTSIIFRSVVDGYTVIMLNNLRSNKLYDIGIEILKILNKEDQ